MHCAHLLFPFAVAEDVPEFNGDPMDLCEVRGGIDAVEFEEIGVAIETGGIGEQKRAARACNRSVQVEQSEHLAVDGLVADPEDKIIAPLHRLDNVRKGEEKGAKPFSVHGEKYRAA